MYNISKLCLLFVIDNFNTTTIWLSSHDKFSWSWSWAPITTIFHVCLVLSAPIFCKTNTLFLCRPQKLISKFLVVEYLSRNSISKDTTYNVLNCLGKLTSQKPSIHSEGVDKIFFHHLNALRKSGLAPSDLPTMGYLWSKQDGKVDKEKETDVNKKKNRNVYFCVAYSNCFYVYPQGDQQAKKIF